jgi:phosphate uptake regulator
MLTNPRYQDGAVVGDIVIHGYTQKSRDMIELVKRRLIGMVSVEHTGDERYNASTRQLEAESLNFSGFAFVNKGACKLCRINEEAPLASADEPIEAPQEVQEDTMELKELETQVAELKKELAAMQAPKIEVAEPVVDNSRELAEAKEIEELRAQVKELMSRPAAPVVAAAPIVQHVELKEPETNVYFDRKARHVGGY